MNATLRRTDRSRNRRITLPWKGAATFRIGQQQCRVNTPPTYAATVPPCAAARPNVQPLFRRSSYVFSVADEMLVDDTEEVGDIDLSGLVEGDGA